MGLSDPFGTTYAGAYKGAESLGKIGEGIYAASKTYEARKKEKRDMEASLELEKQKAQIKSESELALAQQKQEQAKQFMADYTKQFFPEPKEPEPIMKTEEIPLTLKDYTSYAQKEMGAPLRVESTMPEEQQLDTAKRLIESYGLKGPEAKTRKVLDLDKAAQQTKEAEKPRMPRPGMTYKPLTGDISMTFAGEKQDDIVMASAKGLDPQQQLEGWETARKVAGQRKAKEVVSQVYAMMKAGFTKDQIEDKLRESEQSPLFKGAWRDAAESIFSGKSEKVEKKGMDRMDRLLEKAYEAEQEGDVKESEKYKGQAKNYIKKTVRDTLDLENRKQLYGKERTIQFFEEIKGDMNTLKARGIDTGIFTGTAEAVANKIGKVTDPGVKKLATKIRIALMDYRRSMSGVAFPKEETAQYKDVFPSIGKDISFNFANIEGLQEKFGGDIDFFYSMSMGEEAYNELFKKEQQATQQAEQSPTRGEAPAGAKGWDTEKKEWVF